MLRYTLRVTVLKKEGDTNDKVEDFPLDVDGIVGIRELIKSKIDNVHFVYGDGDVYLLHVDTILVNT